MPSERDASRHRPSEPFSPRARDLIADRLHLLSALLDASGTSFDLDGLRWDGEALARIAQDQERLENELLESFRAFREIYAAHTAARALHLRVLETGIETVARADADRRRAAALRLCRLQRPPLAKVHAAIAEARRGAA